MAKKIMLCRCEDVTLADLEHCVDRGYLDIEEVKRYTGFGTGPCQGKECLVHVAALCAAHSAKEGAADPARPVRPFTARPPMTATSFGTFARAEEEPE